MTNVTSVPLPRTLEPEFMDDPVDSQLYDAMDHRQVNDRFVTDLLCSWFQQGAPFTLPVEDKPGIVVDLGTGTARIPIELCLRCDNMRVLGVDAATSMLEIAIRNIEAAGLRERVQLLHADVKQLHQLNSSSYSGVISNTLLHHIPEPLLVLREAIRIVRPGGRIFIRDLLRPESATEAQRLTLLHAAGEPPESQQLLNQSLHAALTLSEVRALLETCGLNPADVQQTSDRHWTLDTQKAA